MRPITSKDEIIDVRDVIACVEDLEQEARETFDAASDADIEDAADFTAYSWLTPTEADELRRLHNLLEELKGSGGDEQWRGDWYPVTLIRDDHFETYARELADDLGAIPSDYSWPTSHIDWEAAADALLVDYTSVEIDGVTYYFR